MTLDTDMAGWDEYRGGDGAPERLNEEALGLYRERWALAEICAYVAELRRPHEETSGHAQLVEGAARVPALERALGQYPDAGDDVA